MGGLITRVPETPAPAGPEWLDGLRRESAARLRAEGFPSKKNEAWRFTSVREVVDTAFEAAGPRASAAAEVDALLGDDGTFRVVLAGGRPLLDVAGAAPDGVEVHALSDALAEDPTRLEPVLGRLVDGAHFAALSNALFEDGLLVVLRRGARPEIPVHVVHAATPSDAPSASYPRVVVLAEEGSDARLVESFVDLDPTGDARHFMNAVTEVQVGPGARLDHVRITEGTARSLQLAHLGVALDRDAFYGSRIVALGGALTRLDVRVRFDGPGSEVELDGAYHVTDGEHVDHQLRVDHEAGHCTSRVRYHGLLDGRGHAVFNAMGVVHRDAPGSAAHQVNRNLLLSDDATIDTKPHLEIDCDEVAASHGTTVGALDETQLFYHRSRGIPEPDARSILTYAFVRELLDRVGHPPLVAREARAMLARLPRGESLEELAQGLDQ